MGMTGRALVAVSGALAVVALAGMGCGSDSTDDGAGGGPAGASCWPSDPSCKLESGAGFQCLALHDNGVGTRGTYRMSQLEVAKPPLLAGQFLQDTVVTKAITLNWTQCLQEGTGRFSWLFDVDWAAGIAKTGGGHITQNPKGGYCWIDEMVSGFHTEPMEVELVVGQDGEYRTFDTKAPIPSLFVPIYLTDDESSSIMMPLHQVTLTEGRVSPDNNCIGSWDGDGLTFDNNCKPDRTLDQRMQWLNGAKLSGYITGVESDQVWIPEMQQTLCVALSGDAEQYGEAFEDGDRKGKRCKLDPATQKILAMEKADWCSTTDLACSPPDADAFRLEGMFAASGAKINDTCP